MEPNNAVIDGTIEAIFDEKHISEKFNAREFVVNTGGQYPQMIKCQLVNQKCDLILGMKVGDRIIARANLRGRKANNVNNSNSVQYFNSIDVWKIEKPTF